MRLITVLCFSHQNGFWFEILESIAKPRLWRLTDMQLVGVICVHFAK